MKRFIIMIAGAVLLSLNLALAAEQAWFLMGRHGECNNIEGLKRIIPALGPIHDPYAFAELMRGQGYATTITEIPTASGKAVMVEVADKEVGLIFVSPELCREFEGR